MFPSDLKISINQTLAKVKNLELKGSYEEAYDLLRPIWKNISEFPKTDGFSFEESADVFLHCGSLLGFLGLYKQVPNAQELSKDLLTQAHQRFVVIQNTEKIAECENYLEAAYQRIGEIREAKDWLNESLSKNLPDDSQIRLYSFILQSLLFRDEQNYKEILKLGKELKETFDNFAIDVYRGCFYNHIALAHSNLKNYGEAKNFFAEAINFFKLAEHYIYLGATQNNFSLMLKDLSEFKNAHHYSIQSTEIFKLLNDKTREAFSLDTRAQIFIAEKKYEEALKYVNEAICLLEKGESLLNLVNSYRTKVKILIKLNLINEALKVMISAHNIASIHISQELAQQIIDETSEQITTNKMPKLKLVK